MIQGGEHINGLSAEELSKLGGGKNITLPKLDDPEHGYDVDGDDTDVEDDVIVGGFVPSNTETTVLMDLPQAEKTSPGYTRKRSIGGSASNKDTASIRPVRKKN
jgi:hypothetical protein